jgi:peptidoglycan biosynthesis protein MviN/MurJ (putative lipid II flippase)
VLPAAIALVLSTIANVVFLPIYGPRAAAIVTVAVEWGLVSMLYSRIRRPCSLHLPIRWAASIAAVTGAALGIAALARNAGGGEFTMAATFAVAFVGLVLGLKLTTLSEMLNPLASS